VRTKYCYPLLNRKQDASLYFGCFSETSSLCWLASKFLFRPVATSDFCVSFSPSMQERKKAIRISISRCDLALGLRQSTSRGNQTANLDGNIAVTRELCSQHSVNTIQRPFEFYQLPQYQFSPKTYCGKTSLAWVARSKFIRASKLSIDLPGYRFNQKFIYGYFPLLRAVRLLLAFPLLTRQRETPVAIDHTVCALIVTWIWSNLYLLNPKLTRLVSGK
jgi:hypothetical protein